MATKQELEQELAQAREQLRNLASVSQPAPESMGEMLMKEMQALNKKASKSTTSGIPYKVIDDHKNIALYTELNKVIGPMHPANAKTTMERFYAAGYPLFTTQRTEEQIEAYKQSDRYKKRESVRESERNRKFNKKPAAQIMKFAKMVAQETGKSMKDELVLPQKG